jgi:hypothetical protein
MNGGTPPGGNGLASNGHGGQTGKVPLGGQAPSALGGPKHPAPATTPTKGPGTTPVHQTKLPQHPAKPPVGNQAGRVKFPEQTRPKMTLMKGPGHHHGGRLGPFVQRHWKGPFFFAAVAGLGYLTVPEGYYDRFVAFVSGDEPDYEGAVALLSEAAVAEEAAPEVLPVPSNIVYRYRATAAPAAVMYAPVPAPARVVTSISSGQVSSAPLVAPISTVQAPVCQFKPFVARKWNQQSSWVLIPQVGNVTVPDDYYDRFFAAVSAEPPQYPAACAILTEAAANDTVVAAQQ